MKYQKFEKIMATYPALIAAEGIKYERSLQFRCNDQLSMKNAREVFLHKPKSEAKDIEYCELRANIAGKAFLIGMEFFSKFYETYEWLFPWHMAAKRKKATEDTESILKCLFYIY